MAADCGIGRRHRSRRSSANDDDILQLQRLLVMWWPDGSRSVWARSAMLIASAWVTGRLGPKTHALGQESISRCESV
jgi:hypothetical protein